MWFITLENKQFIVEAPAGFCRCDATVSALANLLVEQGWWGEGFTCSSNLDFPEAAGLPEDLPVRQMMGQAIAKARQVLVAQVLQKCVERPSRLLSEAEASWVERAAALFAEMPATIHLAAVGGRVYVSEPSPLDEDGDLDPTNLLAEVAQGRGKVLGIREI